MNSATSGEVTSWFDDQDTSPTNASTSSATKIAGQTYAYANVVCSALLAISQLAHAGGILRVMQQHLVLHEELEKLGLRGQRLTRDTSMDVVVYGFGPFLVYFMNQGIFATFDWVDGYQTLWDIVKQVIRLAEYKLSERSRTHYTSDD